ncbi:RNase P modulator RnpM [Rhodothermus marinus]|uniref:RNase P modulator RnpM n=1 Tax=Rhodothermus marinus TaxID=29549 RepID=UPI0037C7E28D
MSKKHVPIRSCVVCRTRRPKHELVRIVRRPDGRVELDPEQKKPGRGAYLCPQPSCWKLKAAIPRLQRALRTELDAEARAALAAWAERMQPATPADART